MKFKVSSFIIILALVAIVSSCVENPNPVPEVAPEVPMAEMYTIPTEAVTESTTDTTSGSTMGNTYKNWVHAGVNLLVWNTAIIVNTAVPVTAFSRAVNETATYVGNGTFEWSYQYQGPVHTYDVVLTGQYINGGQDVEWIMNVSQVGGFSNFEWYRGISATDFSEATFTVNHRPFNPAPYLQIDYQRDYSNDHASIRYTNVNTSNNSFGGYLEYRVEPTSSFNRAFDIQGGQNSPNTFIEIQWLEPTGQGRVKNPDFFNDNDWHCWDQNRADTDC
jgi:hypothetical protein